MRPAILFPLFAETRTLPGVGPRIEKLIAHVAGKRLLDLVFDLPCGVVDRSYRPKLSKAEPGRIATVTLTVQDHVKPRAKFAQGGRQPYRVRCSDGTASIDLIFFHSHWDYLENTLPPGAERVVSGRIERYKDKLQMPHPDYVLEPGQERDLPLHEPIYALTEGLPQKSLAKAIRAALDKVPVMPEWQDAHFFKARRWVPFGDALRSAHAPAHEADLAPETETHRRLAYDELLANQLALIMIRSRMRAAKGRVIQGSGHLRAKAIAALPFALTAGQVQSLKEIESDMAAPNRMLRLLQGDVGAGKTVVAMLALLNAVDRKSVV